MSSLLSLNQELYQYLLSQSLREPDALCSLREATSGHPQKNMMTLPDQAQFIHFLLQLMCAKRVIEVDVFTGYATGWMALGLPAEGQLIACDVNAENAAIGKPHWEALSIADKIDLRIGDAAKTLNMLLKCQSGDFDACAK